MRLRETVLARQLAFLATLRVQRKLVSKMTQDCYITATDLIEGVADAIEFALERHHNDVDSSEQASLRRLLELLISTDIEELSWLELVEGNAGWQRICESAGRIVRILSIEPSDEDMLASIGWSK